MGTCYCVNPDCVYRKKHYHPAFFRGTEIPEGKTTTSSDAKTPFPYGCINKMLDEQLKRLDMRNPDLINHPPHYTKGGVETFDFIRAKGLTYAEGNVIKYVVRARHKGNLLDDLKKARWYIEKLIEEAETDKSDKNSPIIKLA